MTTSETTDHQIAKQLKIVDKLACLLDGRFRLFGVKIGLDPIIGLIPGLGDIAPVVVAVYSRQSRCAKK